MRILVADDNHFYRLALTRMLTEWGFEVIEAKDGLEAWDILRSHDAPKLVILDWMMPGLSGPEVCRRVRAANQAEPSYIIILTGLVGSANMVTAMHAGADDFINKPFDPDQLKVSLNVGQRIVSLQTSQTVVFTLARAAEARSPYTQGHADRVTYYALALAAELNVSVADVGILRNGALLHDLGKISMPDSILNKPGPLTPQEMEIVRQHPVVGVEILKPLQSLKSAMPLVRWHHERCDGKGYPDGLARKQIPDLVRILSVADVYDALKSTRPYRPAIPHQECLEMLKKDAARGGLDPELVSRFCKLPVNVFDLKVVASKLEFFHTSADAIASISA